MYGFLANMSINNITTILGGLLFFVYCFLFCLSVYVF
jgi:hypothetical protein